MKCQQSLGLKYHKQSKIKYKWAKLLQAFLIVNSFILSPHYAVAQIIPDTTLGDDSSFVTSDQLIRGAKADLIEGGAINNHNLFHSFTEFNVNEFQRVYFANPSGIDNILTRITGNNISKILGLLGVNGNANLFLINPHGLYFGEEAKLDISGSFFATTATEILGENGLINITDANKETLLSINPNVFFSNSLHNYQGDIDNQGNLFVGKNLTLQANNLNLLGSVQAQENLTLLATNNITIRDSLETPLILASGKDLLIQGNNLIDIFTLNNNNSGLYSGGNILLRSNNNVVGDAHYYSGGNFKIENLEHNLGNLTSPNDPIIRSLGDVSFDNYLGTSLHILAGGSINIGNVIINGTEMGNQNIDYLKETINLSNGEIINIDGSNEPTLDLRAGIDPTKIGFPNVTGVNSLVDLFVDFSQLIPTLTNPNLTNIPSSANINIGTVAFFNINVNDVLAGNLNFTPENLLPGKIFLTNNYHPNSNLQGDINLGNFKIIPSIFPNDIQTLIQQTSIISNGGELVIDSRNNINNQGAISLASNLGTGGNITFLAQNDINLNPYSVISTGAIPLFAFDLPIPDNITIPNFINTFSNSVANGGNINFQAGHNINTNYTLITTSGKSGYAGSLTLNSGNQINFNNTIIRNDTRLGTGGLLNINADYLLLTNSGIMVAKIIPQDLGESSDLIINVPEITLNSSFLISQNRGSEVGGNIGINSNNLILENGSGISGVTDSPVTTGKGANISINSAESVIISGFSPINNNLPSFIGSGTISSADGGDILIKTPLLRLENGGVLFTTAANNNQNLGSGGNINLDVNKLEISGNSPVNPSFISLDFILFGDTIFSDIANQKAGDLTINANQILIEQGGFISTTTFNQAQGGNMNINANNIDLKNNPSNNGFISGILAQTVGDGNGGTININSTNLTIADNTRISVSTGIGTTELNSLNNQIKLASQFLNLFNQINLSTLSLNQNVGTGNAGNININSNNISINNQGQILGTTFGQGKGGNLDIASNFLDLDNNSKINVSTDGIGNGGIINIQTAQNLLVTNNSQISSSANINATGNGGNINIFTLLLNLDNNSQINVSTNGIGNAGNININSNNVSLNNQGQILGTTIGKGNGGNIDIASNFLNLNNNSKINVNTNDIGDAGKINLQISQDLTLNNNSQISSSADQNSTGNGGNIWIDPDTININNSGIFVDSKGTGIGGNIEIYGGTLNLNNGQISAVTQSSDGGNINLNLSNFLWLRNNSNISTTAGIAQGAGNGGNITIFAPFIVAFPQEDSNITAQAFNGNGGNINITTNALFCIGFTGDNIPVRNDITVSSKFGLDGNFIFNNLAVDPTSGLIELPSNTVNIQPLKPCSNSQETNSFTNIGTGGLPQNPYQSLSSNDIFVDLRPVNNSSVNSDQKHSTMIQATAWQINEQGNIELIAQESSQNQYNCNFR